MNKIYMIAEDILDETKVCHTYGAWTTDRGAQRKADGLNKEPDSDNRFYIVPITVRGETSEDE